MGSRGAGLRAQLWVGSMRGYTHGSISRVCSEPGKLAHFRIILKVSYFILRNYPCLKQTL